MVEQRSEVVVLALRSRTAARMKLHCTFPPLTLLLENESRACKRLIRDFGCSPPTSPRGRWTSLETNGWSDTPLHKKSPPEMKQKLRYTWWQEVTWQWHHTPPCTERDASRTLCVIVYVCVCVFVCTQHEQVVS